MYQHNKDGTSHHYDYPYEPRTHTFASPAGMHYPAPNTHPLPHRPVTNGEFYQPGIPSLRHGQAQEHARGGRSQHHHGRYGPGDWMPDPRIGLGISTVGHPELVPPQMAPHTSYHLGRHDHFDIPPMQNRSITLDSTSRAGRQAHPISSYSQSPARYQSSGTRTASPLSSQSSQKGFSQPLDRNGRPRPNGRVGGPPKAPLGGIGGKPWDERLNDRSVSSPLPQPGQVSPFRPGFAQVEEEVPTFKGSPIIFKPPPSTYSPEDSPELPTQNLVSEGGEKPCRVRRKDVYPWPVHSPRGPPDTIPLPPSPIDPDPENSGRRTWTSIDSTTTMESDDHKGKRKGRRDKVVVAIPIEPGWDQQKALNRKKARSQEIRDAVLLRPAPAIKAVEPETPETLSGAVKMDDRGFAARSTSNSTPPPPLSTDDPLRIRSPPTPTRRGQSGNAQGSGAFARRQLGGMLRSGPSGRAARLTGSTTSIPESPSSDRGRGKDQAEKEKNGKEVQSTEGVAGDDESTSSLGEGPTVASSAFLRKAKMLKPSAGGSPLDSSNATEVVQDKASTSTSTNTIVAQDLQTGESPLLPSQEEEAGQVVTPNHPNSAQEAITRKQSDADTNTPSAKRLRPTAQPYEPRPSHSSAFNPTPSTRPIPKLRPTASSFTPRAISNTSPTSSIQVPAGAGDFTFSTANIKHRGMQSWSSMDSDDQQPIFGSVSLNPTSGDADISGPGKKLETKNGQTVVQKSEPSPECEAEGDGPDIDDTPSRPSSVGSDVERTTRYAISEPCKPSNISDTNDELDIPTARPFSTTGAEERFSAHQRPITAQGSPAAELHGIFASPSARSSSSLSEISDSMEVLSESFDPVSYSYDTDTESTYEVSSTAVFFTSTPRGGHQVLPLNSMQSDSESGRSSPEENHTVPTVNVDHDPRRRFMEWTFPSGHEAVPSIYRRHTFDHLTYEAEDPSSEEHGVASTFASRMGDLRAHLAQSQGQGQGDKSDVGHLRVTSGPSGLLSNRSSAEFPMRSPSRKLEVRNDSTREDQRESVDHPSGSKVGNVPNGWDKVAVRHAELKGSLASILGALESRSEPTVDLSPLTQTLEQQSNLISSLANATQHNRGHQNDHLIPLLEGHQAILDKLSTVESTQSEVTDLLARFDDQQSEVIGELRSELAEIVAEKREQGNRLHQLETEVIEARHAQSTNEKEASERRDTLKMAQSRNAALELHLQSLIKEKQSLTQEYEEDQATRQRQQLLLEQAQADLEAKQEDLVEEKRRNDILAETIRSQSAELAELQTSTSRFHETLVDRLSRIEEGVQSGSVGSGEFAKLQDRNERLQVEVDSLKEKYRIFEQEKHAEAIKSTSTLRELEDLRQELAVERDLKQKATERADAAAEALEKESVSRFQAQMVAKERSHYATMQEVQLEARTRECNYWQTFALTYDRNAYRNYLKSKPFHGISGTSNSSSTPKSSTNSIPTYEELHTHTSRSQTPEAASSKGVLNGDDQQTPTKIGKMKGKAVAMDEDTEAWSSKAE